MISAQLPGRQIFAFIIAIAGFAAIGVASAQQPPPFAITSQPPTELNPTGGGPAQASLQQAAEFAWEEFFALNWPAGTNPSKRDTPAQNCAFGELSPNCAGPLVWETFRAKVEIFPGTGDPPGYTPDPSTSYGYDASPQYVYSPIHTPVPCSTPTPPASTAWLNLDETDQITLDSMYAGVVTATPPINTAPQLIRFLAKANRAEYEYIAKHQWWASNAPTAATAKYVLDHKQDPIDPDSYVVLPDNSIEVKAGWRVLNQAELDATPRRFHTATVRYYEENSGQYCWQQATFGLVSLHIIQKTPLAPYFIYATFEQADNILNAAGNPVEDTNGALLLGNQQPCRSSDQTAPCPTTPTVVLNDTAVVSNPQIPPNVLLVPSNAKYCTDNTGMTPKNQLFYLNSTNLAALPSGGYVCINQRDNDIPPVVVDTNRQAHGLIDAYGKAHDVKDSVWQYYKLVNVQYLPIDKEHASLYGTEPGEKDFNKANNPTTYYLANIVVETNRPLQLFSGGLVGGGGTGSNSDYASQFSAESGSTDPIHHNMFFNGQGYNMGGCMGCHGSQGQTQGGDFSVIVARGRVGRPEAPAPVTSNGAAKILRNRILQ